MIKLFGLDFKFNQSKNVILLGFMIMVLSNFIIFVVYKFDFGKKKNNVVSYNNMFNKCVICIIYLFTFFSFYFAVTNILEIGLSNITNNMILRGQLSTLGPFAIILMFPLGVSTYYWIRLINGERKLSIKCSSVLFSLMALVVAFFRGQRTDIILIILLPLIYYFYKKRKISILLFSFIGLIVLSSIYAIFFKVTTNNLGLKIGDAIKGVVTGDLDRNWTYWMSVGNSRFISNDIMNEPYSGYIYTILTFIPRSLIEFKGYSTETWFVYFMGNNIFYEWGVASLSNINWGITLSGLSEGFINGGYVGGVIFSILTGYILREMDYLLEKYEYLTSCIPFIALLLAGYTFYNIIVIYLPVVITLIVLNKRDIRKGSYPSVEKSFDNHGDL
ncbi:O-antigen polymerase [Paenibacillus sp. FSL L8-0340]|uniref:O-antigen polymerase n=1 Tax=Paenibacillus sp. FSL L8-0340 TaxID=2954685 RepID=UPI003158DDAF